MTDLGVKAYPSLTSFGGINTGVSPFNIGEGESSDMINLSGDNTGAIAQRKEAEKTFKNDAFEEICYFGKLFNGKPFCIATESGERGLYYYNEQWCKISAADKILQEIENAKSFKTVNFSEKCTVLALGSGAHLISIGEDLKAAFIEKSGEEPVPEDVSFLAAKNERLLTASRHNVNFTISGYQELNWKNADDIEIFYVRTQAGDSATGLTCFGDMTLYFKENSTHILYGKTPDSYYLDVLSHSAGCISDKSIAETASGLLWLSKDGIYTYNATTRPYKVSDNVKKYIDNMTEASSACGGSDGVKYFISLKQSDGGYVLLVFDTEKKMWHVWENPGYKDFVNIGGNLYASDGKVFYKMEAEKNSGEWYFITKPFDVGGAARKSNIFKIFLNFYAEAGASLELYISGEAEGDSFTSLYRKKFGSNTYMKEDVIIAPGTHVRDLKYFRLKIAGSGVCTVYGLDVYMRVKGRSY